jgi:hypothetical protein
MGRRSTGWATPMAFGLPCIGLFLPDTNGDDVPDSTPTPEVADSRLLDEGLSEDPTEGVQPLSEALTRIASDAALGRGFHEMLGSYCHQSRNLLNTLSISLYLAQREGHGDCAVPWRIEPLYKEVERFYDRLQAICRPLPHEPVTLPLALLFQSREEDWSHRLGVRGRRLMLTPSVGPAVGEFDPARLQVAFDDLVAWRAEVGPLATALRIVWKAEDGWFRVIFDEIPDLASEGQGITTGRDGLDRSVDRFPRTLAVLTMPMLARAMTVHGGRLVEPSRDPWRLELCWPLVSPR